MDIHTGTSVAYFVAVAALLAVAALCLSASRTRRHRRQAQHAREAARQRARTSSAPGPLADGLTAETVQALRAHGERTAMRYWQAGRCDEEPVNPHERGSREHVIWYASFQLALHELRDAQPTLGPSS